MAKALTKRGHTLVGAAKVVALHSMMRECENPIGEGHPDEDDERSMRELVAGVLRKTAAKRPEAISLSELAYQSEAVHKEMEKVTLEMAKGHLPQKQLAEDRCTECGICEEICPVGAITLSPYPHFDETCICCFECVRNCPEAAILADLAAVEDRIRGRAEQFNEKPLTQVWL
jgi:ferredoxin